MADISATYVLDTPSTDITFNNGAIGDGTNLYWITNIEGLDGPPIRTPIDNAPQTDGGLVHNFFLGPRHILIEGVLLIQSTRVQNSVLTIRNSMEASLLAAHMAIKAANGTLTWTPLGQAQRQLTVRGDVPVSFRQIDNYLNLAFAFGLVAADPTW